MPPEVRTRFAPSPTGYLHLGHAYSALIGQSRATPGQFLLRIEDTDTARVRPDYEAAIYADLAWLGLDWQRPVLRQSEHLARYRTALNHLISLGVCYPCSCTRGDILAALSAPQERVGPPQPEAVIYPGTCRNRSLNTPGPNDAIRLDMREALAIGGDLGFTETGPERPGLHQLDHDSMIRTVGDIVLARRDIHTASYHLAVVVDDAAQDMTEVVRGTDLFEATFIHRLLQSLLQLPTPSYYHHGLIRDETGKRLAKRDDARALRTYRANGATPQDIRAMLGL